MARSPISLAELTLTRLTGVDEVRAFDPSRPEFIAWLPVGSRSSPGDTLQILDVTIDFERKGEQLATLRALTLAAARLPTPSRPTAMAPDTSRSVAARPAGGG